MRQASAVTAGIFLVAALQYGVDRTAMGTACSNPRLQRYRVRTARCKRLSAALGARPVHVDVHRLRQRPHQVWDVQDRLRQVFN